ncbi:MAG: hypothetical protein MUQ10_04575 [Anaerolineae bacterium]|nr:hypothetical protein [Anaerolineae bacterium]
MKQVSHYAQNDAQRREEAEWALQFIWCDTVAGMIAEPRSSVKYANVFPDDAWGG